jgi:AraC-like DNA-binding protein
LIEHEAFRGRMDLSTVARRVGASASHLSRAFQRTHGIGFAAFLLETRLEQSRRLLRETGLRVAEVSERCGFSSASHFHHVFRRAVHATPEQYRASSAR